MQHTLPTASLLCILSLTGSGCNQRAPAFSEAAGYSPRLQLVEVEVVSVERHAITDEQQFTGNLLPRRITRIMSEVDGVVKEIPRVGAKFDVTLDGQRYSEQLGITYGQVVSEGDLLIQLDPRDFEIALRIDQSKLLKAQADLAKLQSWERPEEVRRLAALRNEVVARLEQSQRNLARMKKLLPSHAITEAEYEQAEMEVSSAKAMVDSAEASFATAEAGPTIEEIAVQQALVEQAKAEVEQKERQLEKTSIRAPYDGVVTAINVEVGERVSTSGEPLVEVMNLRYLIAEVGVPEAYIGGVHVNDQATVDAAGSSEPVPGLVVAINEMVDPSTRTFRVRIAIDNAASKFKAGQFASVQLGLKSAGEESLVVPSRSLVFIEGEPHVFVVENNHIHQRAVQTGLSSNNMVEILDGLQLSDQVVVDDPALLAEGMEVSVKPTIAQIALGVPRSP